MKKTIEISGHSDDLVEVKGDFEEEWTITGGDGFVALSTGDVFRVVFDEEGFWRVKRGPKYTCDLQLSLALSTDPDRYTEVVTVTGPIKWVECWDAWPIKNDEISEKIDNIGLDDLTTEKLLAVYRMVAGHEA